MKLSSREYLPRHGSSSLVRDDGDDHRPSTAALKEMAREQSLVTQLRAVVLPAIQADDERTEVIAHMFETILDCSAKAMTALKLLLRLDHGGGRRAGDDHAYAAAEAADDKMGVRKVFSDDGDCRDYDDNAKPHRLRKRRRLADDCVTLETPVPHYDGHQWRKYGQKYINHAKHPRSYYRCTYKQEQDCKATKTVQQQDGGGDSSCLDDDSAMYSVVYYGQHTCKPGDADSGAAGAVETASTGTDSSGGASGDGELARSDSVSPPCVNVSVTCTSVVVVDGRHRISAPSSSTSLQESNSKQLLDMAEEYLLTSADQVNNKSDMFDDVVASAPLDFGTVWDWALDAHVDVGDYWYY